ncbi:MAG: hypothetical protein WCX94_02230, partial [Candidatus Dojkabacteria bacterium]
MDNIKTIQGLNLESPTTRVQISDIEQSEDVKNLLDHIKDFHPIFIESYTFKDGSLSISSKLPAIWRESSETFRELSKNKITYKEAEDYVVDTVIKLQVKSMSTIPILHKAQQLGYETTLTVVDEGIIPGVAQGYGTKWNRYYTIGCGRKSQITCSISSTLDSIFGKNIQQDKWLT